MLSCISHATNSPIFTSFFAKASKEFFDKVNAVIEERVRPALLSDGGDITLKDITDGIVTVQMFGHCVGCPSKQITLNSRILDCLQDEFGDKDIVDIKEIPNTE
ncbi:NifU-like domain containing protein [Trichomonas vaginalis G3]|uniref:NifU-like domain containing protein n=1 Tax=Trichomonas vaginalis (strain ATCC PRA-98 / G3) TaxID=412133 RepID=A2DJQ8_TRIV3|nr:NFU1 iron-sulfur cluster scaffold [Trichomonas vaginalis G3]EAY19272.1 NifU-like domain containing protein [Trichomonas vaginalis G3]KAI5527174.1 NFU1 iron-sulfur cluster scaffold [Trichomonas vaginalis G3]|eukprot:XP_001580258.1 NifU-like domain containing protein [Trichomonas vaginalis G3]